jgi:hypothetical protein
VVANRIGQLSEHIPEKVEQPRYVAGELLVVFRPCRRLDHCIFRTRMQTIPQFRMSIEPTHITELRIIYVGRERVHTGSIHSRLVFW